MTNKTPKPPKLTDAERYKRFLDAAKAAGASDDPKDFETAFLKVAGPKSRSIDHPAEKSESAKEEKGGPR
jgi:hypothetical protein